MVFREPGLFFQKVYGEKKQAAGCKVNPGRSFEIVVRNYASSTATISCVRGLMITISSPTRM